MNVLLDTNVVLDLLLAREPYVADATSIMALVERRSLRGVLCATTVTTIGYLVTRATNLHRTREALRKLLQLCDVAAVDHRILTTALDLSISDYEDAVLHAAAQSAAVDCIITRNVRDFKTATLPVYEPHEFLAAYHAR